MNEIIAKTIYEYSNNLQIISYDALLNIFNMYVEQNNLSNYVKKLIIDDKVKKYAYYDYNKNIVAINLKITCDRYILFNGNLNDKNDYIKLNSWIIYLLLHELNHVNQFKNQNGDTNIEQIVLKSDIRQLEKLKSLQKNMLSTLLNKKIKEYRKINKFNQKITLDNNIIIPRERNADLNGYRQVLEAISDNDELVEGKRFIEEKYNNVLLSGYEENFQGPTINYLKLLYEQGIDNSFKSKQSIIDSYTKLANNNALSTEERLFYGLPVSQVEYEKVKDELVPKV